MITKKMNAHCVLHSRFECIRHDVIKRPSGRDGETNTYYNKFIAREEYIYGVDGIVGEQRGATPCFIFMTPTQWSTQNDPHPLRNVNPPKNI